MNKEKRLIIERRLRLINQRCYQWAIKLASNWHQMVIKHLSNLRKCYEITEQFKKSSHDKDKDKDKENLSNQSNSLKEQKN